MPLRALAIITAVLGTVALATPADAVTGSTGGPGADVSWPQCGQPLPGSHSFGVVGVNGGLGNTTNPCLADELTWAAGSTGGTDQPLTSLYVMAQDPGHQASWWPDSDQIKDGTAVTVPAQYGLCQPGQGSAEGEESAACAYVYGYDMAEEDATARGVTTASDYRWWIDVETTNTWALTPAENAADLEGMVAAFAAAGATVGLYSTPYQWQLIAGSTAISSPLAGLSSWIANVGGLASAESNCYTSGLTPGGAVALAQYQSGAFDADLACHPMTAAPTPTVTGTAAVDQVLTAHPGAWSPSPVTLHYQWMRGTSPISGATGSTYRTASADAGRNVSVQVTGAKAGYTTVTRSSGRITIARPMWRLNAPHSLASGKTLLAPNGRYHLTQQSDGDLVLYKDTGKALWSTHRSGHGYTTTMQSDGNLVTYAPGHHAVWSSRTNGKHATYAAMQSDGNFVLYTSAGRAVWSTHTNGR